MAAIETDALTRRYGEVVAVDSVDLTVEQGEVFGFLGPNGAGKSTLINMLLDYTPPTSGEARVFGHRTRGEAVDIRERVGVLPDAYQLYERLSGRRHLEFVVQARQADDDPDAILDRVGLDPEDAEREAGEYSKGMAQRLVLGMALIGEPDLLVLDEPSTGLDPNGIRLMRDIIREEVDRGATVFFSSHILSQVEAVCDRVGIMNEGRLIEVATLDEIRDTIGVGTTLHVTVDQQPDLTLSDLEAMDDVSNVRADGPELTMNLSNSTAKAKVINRLEDGGATVTDFETAESSLEELFTELIDEDEDEAEAEVSA